MKHYGSIIDSKDITTKEYVDNAVAEVLPSNGQIGDIFTKTGESTVGWVTPASNFEGDNTRPATAGLVNTQIGNINALLATI